jgi:hypothetical protein
MEPLVKPTEWLTKRSVSQSSIGRRRSGIASNDHHELEEGLNQVAAADDEPQQCDFEIHSILRRWTVSGGLKPSRFNATEETFRIKIDHTLWLYPLFPL